MCDDEAGLVADSARAVLIGSDAVDAAHIEDIAAVAHSLGQREGLAVVESVEADRHEPRRHLIVGDIAVRIAVHNVFYLLVGEGDSAFGLVDDIDYVQNFSPP